jgi:hypothetical protein
MERGREVGRKEGRERKEGRKKHNNNPLIQFLIFLRQAPAM